LDPSGVISAKEKQIRDTLLKLESIDSEGSTSLTMEELATVRRELAESKSLVSTHEQTINELHHENEHLTKKRDELEIRLNALELEYEELLDKTIAEEEANNNIDITETIAELRSKLEAQFVAKKEVQQKEIDELKQELEKKNEELYKLNNALAELKRANEELQNVLTERDSRSESQKNVVEKEKDMERIRKTMAQQLADFDVMKKALMRDLQNRCEKVVELEISLDETREQYNNVLRNNNNKAQQKKMAFLERNLEQLTNVQKQLVDQNASLKKEVAIAERKLLARNERIQALEALLQDAQEKLTSQNQKFEAQLQAVRERLEQARSQKSAANPFAVNSLSRIVKPLRGGVDVSGSDSPFEIAKTRFHSKTNLRRAVPVSAIKKEDKHLEFCKKYGIKFSNEDLIHQVCTHKSVISNTAPTNERLDYLGQKAIQLFAAEFFLGRVPPEELHEKVDLYTKHSDNLGIIGRKMGLDELLYWTPTNAKEVEMANQEGHKLKPKGIETVTGRALQALVGAIYHDQGDFAAREFVDKHILTAPIK
ncbi:3057_t:CDS:10, partial [Acaulospora morrowiae]